MFSFQKYCVCTDNGLIFIYYRFSRFIYHDWFLLPATLFIVFVGCRRQLAGLPKSVARGQGISSNRPKEVVSFGTCTPIWGHQRYITSFCRVLPPQDYFTTALNPYYFLYYTVVGHCLKTRWRRCVCTNVQPH